MKIYFFCYDWSIDKDTGAVSDSSIHASAFEPTGDNTVQLGEMEVDFTPPGREAVAVSALEGLDAFEIRSREQHLKNMADISDKRATYMLLSGPTLEDKHSNIDDGTPF